MEKVLIYGCGFIGKSILIPLRQKFNYNIIGYIDKNKELPEHYLGIPILKVKENLEISEIVYDYILIAINNLEECKEIKTFLEEKGCDKCKIKLVCFDADYVELFSDQRTEFIKDYALWCRKNKIEGSTAECGVFKGDSAKFINYYFSGKKLYLFDTFAGFEKSDLEYEITNIKEGFCKDFFNNTIFRNTAIDEVMSKMKYPNQVVVRQGYFPESAAGIDEKFCFVNLDMDLYIPMLAGLRFFWNRMEKGGCILLHDYFHEGLKGVEKAVLDFEEEIGVTLTKIPIGDHFSLAIIK